MNESQQPSAREISIRARFRNGVAFWRAYGYRYVTLTPKGNAQPHRAGTLATLLHTLARYPGAQIVELAAEDAEQTIVSWALNLALQPIERGGVN